MKDLVEFHESTTSKYDTGGEENSHSYNTSGDENGRYRLPVINEVTELEDQTSPLILPRISTETRHQLNLEVKDFKFRAEMPVSKSKEIGKKIKIDVRKMNVESTYRSSGKGSGKSGLSDRVA